jgi:hypothetical protein
MPEPSVHEITLRLSERAFRNLEALTGTPFGPETAEEVIYKVLDHVDQAVYRSGAWEREWLCRAFGYDWLEHLEPDPRYPNVPSWQRPIAAPHAGRGLVFVPGDLGAWRALCEHIEEWLAASGPPSRRRRSIHTQEVSEEHRWLLATPRRRSRDRLRRDEAGNLVPDYTGNPCGLSQAQARLVARVRGRYRLVKWARSPGEGWSLDGHGWRKRLAELEELERLSREAVAHVGDPDLEEDAAHDR